VPIEGSEFTVDCDQVIAAIGQFPNLDGTSEEHGVKRTKWKTIAIDDFTFQTDDPRVFAGGDVVLGAQTVIQAVAQGKKAAWSMDAYLRGDDMQAVSKQLHDLRRTPFVEALGVQVRAKEGWTDVALFSQLSIPAVNFGPGDPNWAHHDQEHCPVGQLADSEAALLRWLDPASA